MKLNEALKILRENGMDCVEPEINPTAMAALESARKTLMQKRRLTLEFQLYPDDTGVYHIYDTDGDELYSGEITVDGDMPLLDGMEFSDWVKKYRVF